MVTLSSWALGLFAVCSLMIVAAAQSDAPAPAPSAPASDDQPKNFDYYQIWADQEGETHFTKCRMTGFNLTVYSSLPQYVRSDFGGAPLKMVLTELAVGLAQPLHSAPQVQFVATLTGSWYVQIAGLLQFLLLP